MDMRAKEFTTEAPINPQLFGVISEPAVAHLSSSLGPTVTPTTTAESLMDKAYRGTDRPMTKSPITSARNGIPAASAAQMMTSANSHTSLSILERYAQTIPLSASCQSIQKRCLFPDCTKMSVSKGLCRGHGGGRRCHFVGGCTKSAQSRSMFCWAHGGGQRCDVEGCMRSRKTKHYCVAHMQLEPESSGSASASSRVNGAGKSTRIPRARRSRYAPVLSRKNHVSPHRMLPSLGQALSAASLSRPNFPVLPQTRERYLGH